VKKAFKGFLYPFGGFCFWEGDHMADERAKRKLTAILSADVKGYSRLMGEDEKATVETLKTYRGVMGELIRQYRGRVVDSPGDNVLSEFASVVDAVECAVKIQEELKTRNEDLPENRRMEFRIGVHHGDVIEDEDRIYGDGVNVAARIEGLAEGGGICISKTSFDSVKNKLNLGYEHLGDHNVKNITEPVRVYKVLMKPEYAGKVIGEERLGQRQWKWAAIGGMAVLFIVIGALAIWNIYFRPAPIEPASVEKTALPLPDKPSIAVLPFVNMSDDPKQEYFSDGMSEDIITDLSRISGLLVLSRSTTFVYKGQSVKIDEIAKELGVRYVLEGSVRKVGEQVRINAQLIDASKGHHLWADRYDGKLKDIFQLQDEITQKIVTSLAVKLSQADQEHVATKETDNIQAYDAVLKASDLMYRYSLESFARALSHLEKAVELDPNYARAYAMMADIFATPGISVALGLSWEECRLRSREYLRIAFKKPTNVSYNVASWYLYRLERKFEKAVEAAERGLALNPSDALCNMFKALALIFADRAEEALDFIDRAQRIDPGCLF